MAVTINGDLDRDAGPDGRRGVAGDRDPHVGVVPPVAAWLVRGLRGAPGGPEGIPSVARRGAHQVLGLGSSKIDAPTASAIAASTESMSFPDFLAHLWHI